MWLGNRRGMRLVWCALVLSSVWTHAWSQSAAVTPESEFQKRIKVSEDIQPLGENPFGELRTVQRRWIDCRRVYLMFFLRLDR